MRYVLLTLSLLPFCFFALPVSAQDNFRIEVGTNYERYTNEELRRRVYQLERAVSQLQSQMVQLALRDGSQRPVPVSDNHSWTCRVEAFGKTYVASNASRAAALAMVIKKCSDAKDAMFCKEKDTVCEND